MTRVRFFAHKGVGEMGFFYNDGTPLNKKTASILFVRFFEAVFDNRTCRGPHFFLYFDYACQDMDSFFCDHG